MKVALVHDWLLQQRGGEQVLLRLAQLFPQAPIYTLLHRPGSVDPALENRPIVTSWLQRLPAAQRSFRLLLPLFHRTVRSFDLAGYDLVLSTSHCAAVAAQIHAGQVHVAYVHSPMRYLYDQMDAYLPRWGRPLSRPLAQLATRGLRRRDRAAAQGPQLLLANSAFVARRIARAWQRSAEVVYPPVDVDAFAPPSGAGAPQPVRHGFVCVNALVPYKRTEVAVAWANANKAPLTVVGDGPERRRLQRMAGSTVRLVGKLPRPALRALLWRSEALLFAGEEDFGIAPVEALAAGCPVVALARGGLTESLRGADGSVCGALFASPTPQALADGVAQLRTRQARGELTAAGCRARAQNFAPQRFDAALLLQLRRHLPPAWHRALPAASPACASPSEQTAVAPCRKVS